MRIDYDKDQLAYALANALKERDEAREAFVIATDQMVIAQGKVREANKERDEARDKYATEATDHMLAVNKLCNERDEAQADCLEQARLLGMGSEREARLISERDEAVEEIKEWKTLCLWGGTPEHIHGFIGGQQTRIWHLECERDEAFELLASEKITRNHIIKRSVEVERERDEARNDIVGWENKWRCAVDMAARAELERDDAFNKLKELKDILR